MILALGVAGISAIVYAGKPSAKKLPAPPRGRAQLASRVAKSKAALINLTRQYKATLEGMLAFHEAEMHRAAKVEEERQQLFLRGAVSKQQLEESERQLLDERLKLTEIRKNISDTDDIINEVDAIDDLLRSPNNGALFASGALIRFNGTNNWSIIDSDKVEKFFQEKFGRRLPISAYGQTAVHNQLGFNHHNAIDVAVNPESPEGQALMEFLRTAGIPFLAFRHAIPGAATGAHIHIGKPSARI